MQEVSFGLISTRSSTLGERLRALRAVSRTGLSVLITGETGTGKELLAQAIHAESGRSGRFVAINCAALPLNLIESELFGHVKGAFSGALQARDGALYASSGGTLFLDEVADAPLNVQVALLRALETQRVKPVGSETERSVDLRIVAATSRSLSKMMKLDEFREDLYFRLAGHSIRLPALRERQEDLPALASELCQRIGHKPGLTPSALLSLREYHWPGNVRELKHAIERAVAHTSPGCPIESLQPEEPQTGEFLTPGRSEPRLKFSPEVRVQADVWRKTCLFLLPSGISRRAARTIERRQLLCLLMQERLGALPEELQHRAKRLFTPGWHEAEGGQGAKRLAALLDGQVALAELACLVGEVLSPHLKGSELTRLKSARGGR